MYFSYHLKHRMRLLKLKCGAEFLAVPDVQLYFKVGCIQIVLLKVSRGTVISVRSAMIQTPHIGPYIVPKTLWLILTFNICSQVFSLNHLIRRQRSYTASKNSAYHLVEEFCDLSMT
jgi:hypothetical protein